jgi:hypothetical protein
MIYLEGKDKKDGEAKKDNIGKDEEKEKVVKRGEDKYNFDNFNVAEKNEKDLNDKLAHMEQDSKLMVAYRNNIEFDMSTMKKNVLMKKDDKFQMEKMRRWAVKIYNIYITPMKKMIDPFLQFTIGGNFHVKVYKNKKGETFKKPEGVRGYADKTVVLQNVPHDPPIRTPFDKVIDIEMRMSYSMVSKQKMMIELWEHNTIWMNEILSYMTIPLLDIANGDCNVLEYFLRKDDENKNPVPFAKVEFKCIFQEIWDFKLSFLNWKSSSIFPPKKRVEEKTLPKTQLKIELNKTALIQSYTSSTSEVADESE